MHKPTDLPLKAELKGHRLVIEIGVETLAWATENHPDFWDQSLHVEDATVFAKEVIQELNHEEENGDTLITLMLDKAIGRAINHGAEGIEMPSIEDAPNG